ncbi:essential cell division protein FtsW [Gammaproteobacteria bacterium]
MSNASTLLRRPPLDTPLLVGVLGLILMGLIMVGSASISIATDQSGNPFYFLIRQGVYVGLGLLLGWQVLRIPLRFWERLGPHLLLFGMGLLVIVLIPGIGRNVNGSSRWLGFGPLTIQPSEFVKLFSIIYLSGYVVRRGTEVRRSVWGFVKPLLVLGLIAFLLLLEPDFGTSVVVLVTSMGVLFLAGVRVWQFVVLLIPVISGLMVLAVVSPYRLQRVLSFLDPWQDAFGKGYQLTQALIAFGRGEWFGVGLGGSVQKLHYLPEAHTDFLLSVLAEELGLAGILLIIGLFSFVVWRIFHIAERAERTNNPFAAYLCYGVALWIGFQAFINIGVNMGILPTKGLTLPLMSYGGSSVMVTCMAVALLLRVAGEPVLPVPAP